MKSLTMLTLPCAARLLLAAIRTTVCATACIAIGPITAAHAEPITATPPTALRVSRALAPAPKGVVDLKFGDMFKRPVGPAGLELTEQLRALAGQRVRVVGHMATAEEATPGLLVLSPLPVSLGDEDEKLVDDLPPNAIFVHLSAAHQRVALPNFGGLLQLTGTLEIGQQEEADGHTSHFRLRLDDATSRLLARAAARVAARAPQRLASSAHTH